jgi:HKD family nuclease
LPEVDFLLQGLSEANDHFAALNRLLDLSDIQRCLISVAYMNANGAELVAEKLEKIASRLQIFVCIRNGVTSKQSFEILKSRGVYPICVDTATQAIFHPKVYIALNPTSAILITGSANFTLGGLVKNVEASLIANLDLSNPEDNALAERVVEDFQIMYSRHNENIFHGTSRSFSR